MIDEFVDKILSNGGERGGTEVCVKEKACKREGADEIECGHMHDLTHLDLQTLTFPISPCSYDIILSSVKLKIYQWVRGFH